MSAKWTLVTGANGFLGARLVKMLVDRGVDVKAFVRAGSNLDQLRALPVDKVRIAVGDVRMVDRVYAAMRGCDRCFHLAGSAPRDVRHEDDAVKDAVLGASAVLEAARRADLERVVVTGSTKTLGLSAEPQPLDETAGLDVGDPGGDAEAKYEAEKVALECAEQGAPVVVVKAASMLGPGDWKPTPTGAQILRYLGFSPSFRVPILPGGASYVDVDDIAAGHILAMEKGELGQQYALGGENVSHREFYQLLSDVTGLAEPGDDLTFGKANLAATWDQMRAWWNHEEPLWTKQAIEHEFGKYAYVSSEKAKKELGYEFRPLREALARSCRWYLENGYLPVGIARRARLELQGA